MAKKDVEEAYYSTDKIDNCLFVGNGLNRTLENGVSWGDLLQRIANKNRVDYYDDIPMPMEFERIVNSIMAKPSARPSEEIYDVIKSEISNQIIGELLPDNAIHRKLSDLPVNAVITTNYDSLLEQAFKKWYKFATPLTQKQKYIMNRTSIIDDIEFFHPHGIVTGPTTLCLGYEHYAGLVENLRKKINAEERSTKRMYIEQVLSGDRAMDGSWGERFYTSNMYIIGFGMPQCEIDIWWLLTHRAYLYYTNYAGIKDKIVNEIVFYDIINDKNKLLAEGGNYKDRRDIYYASDYKYRLLEGLHVKVKLFYLSDYAFSYESAYEKIIRDIRDRIRRKAGISK